MGSNGLGGEGGLKLWESHWRKKGLKFEMNGAVDPVPERKQQPKAIIADKKTSNPTTAKKNEKDSEKYCGEWMKNQYGTGGQW